MDTTPRARGFFYLNFLNLFMRFVQKYVQDMLNSTGGNTRTLPECKKKLQYIFKITF